MPQFPNANDIQPAPSGAAHDAPPNPAGGLTGDDDVMAKLPDAGKEYVVFDDCQQSSGGRSGPLEFVFYVIVLIFFSLPKVVVSKENSTDLRARYGWSSKRSFCTHPYVVWNLPMTGSHVRSMFTVNLPCPPNTILFAARSIVLGGFKQVLGAVDRSSTSFKNTISLLS